MCSVVMWRRSAVIALQCSCTFFRLSFRILLFSLERLPRSACARIVGLFSLRDICTQPGPAFDTPGPGLANTHLPNQPNSPPPPTPPSVPAHSVDPGSAAPIRTLTPPSLCVLLAILCRGRGASAP
ncbi:hypothetical protein OF83DRAFT_827318 [Amylostereum chailletii]|nr:hypothetical protein OF83DRAFT_827318 [Amylostereum chailletii]